MEKECTKCGEVKALDEFSNKKDGKNGKRANCKLCVAINLKTYKSKYPKRYLLNAAKGRAKKNGIPFDLTEEDIEIPKICPIFKKPFVYTIGGRHDFTPSLDRVDNTKGYVKENVIVISWKANDLKSNATIKELIMLANFYKDLK